MQPPEELMTGVFLPAVRTLVARRLRGQGFSQSKIASMLGVTQASVSMYLTADVDRSYTSLASLSVPRTDAERYVEILAADARRSPVYAVESLANVWYGLLGRGSICGPHRSSYPMLADCDVCLRMFGSHGRAPEAIAEVGRAVRAIESSRSFVNVMPEVSVNIALLSGDSESPDDVVAVPGRIIKLRDRPAAMQQPAFSSSRHLSRVLLLARTRRKDFRAVINLRHDERMDTVLEKLHLKALVLDDYGESEDEDPTLAALSRKLARHRGLFDVVVDRGGRGIEPNVYFFAKDATDAARLAIKAAEAYSAG